MSQQADTPDLPPRDPPQPKYVEIVFMCHGGFNDPTPSYVGTLDDRKKPIAYGDWSTTIVNGICFKALRINVLDGSFQEQEKKFERCYRHLKELHGCLLAQHVSLSFLARQLGKPSPPSPPPMIRKEEI